MESDGGTRRSTLGYAVGFIAGLGTGAAAVTLAGRDDKDSRTVEMPTVTVGLADSDEADHAVIFRVAQWGDVTQVSIRVAGEEVTVLRKDDPSPGAWMTSVGVEGDEDATASVRVGRSRAIVAADRAPRPEREESGGKGHQGSDAE